MVEYDSMTQEEKDMKYVKQIGIILGITLAGECLNQFLPVSAAGHSSHRRGEA